MEKSLNIWGDWRKMSYFLSLFVQIFLRLNSTSLGIRMFLSSWYKGAGEGGCILHMGDCIQPKESFYWHHILYAESLAF